jgi:hypothetical protein
MLESFIRTWKGEEKLWLVFWIYHFLIGTLLSFNMEGMIASMSLWMSVFYMLVILAWAVFVMVGLWRCAFNAKRRIWGIFARAIVLFFLAMLIWEVVTEVVTS